MAPARIEPASFDGRCLDVVPRAGTTAVAQTYDCLGGTRFAPGEVASDESRVCLDVGIKDDLNRDFEGVDRVNRLQAYSCGDDAQNQVFSIAGPVTGMGGKCLNVRSAGRSNGTAVDISTCTGAASQIWELHW
jgi:hypothetical protein